MWIEFVWNPKSNPMNWNIILGIAATLSLLLPAIAILLFRLYRSYSIVALLFTYVTTIGYNLMERNLLPAHPTFIRIYGIVNNYLDVPLMLLTLLFFCPLKQQRRKLQIIFALYVVYELAIAAIYKLDTTAIIYIMGPGMLIIIVYAFYFFTRYIKTAVESGKGTGKTLMLVAILFAYTCYLIVYLFYYVLKTPNTADAFLLYFIGTIISSVIMTLGLVLTSKRMQQLHEAKNTRRELTMFFNTWRHFNFGDL